MNFQCSNTYSHELDSSDQLKSLKEDFNFPSSNSIYLCGHSLGLQPKSANEFVKAELDAWSNLAVEGHMNGNNPWFDYHCLLTDSMSSIVGSKNIETVVMNSLTTNLHLLMISFFRPNKNKYKIIITERSVSTDKHVFAKMLYDDNKIEKDEYTIYNKWFYEFLDDINVRLTFKENLRIYFAGISLVSTPLGLGQAIKSQIIKEKYGISRSKTLPIIILERFFDLGQIVDSIFFSSIFF